MRISRLSIAEGERIPRGYGIAYYDYVKNEAVCYLIPFNLLINFLRKIYWRIISPSFPKWEEELYKSYGRGYARGVKDTREHLLKTYDEWVKERKINV